MPEPVAPPPPPPAEKKTPWWQKESMFVIAFLVVGPFMLPVVWLHPKLSTSRKVLWTTVIAIVTYFLVVWSMDSIKNIMEQYGRLKTEYGL